MRIMDQPYTDVEIHIRESERGGDHRVDLRVGGTMRAHGYLSPSILPWNNSIDPEADGKLLFSFLFANDSIKREWDHVRGENPQRRIRLHIDSEAPELHAIPWELIHDPQDIHNLASSFSTPFTRYMAVSGSEPKPVDQRPMRLLVAIANPNNLNQYQLKPIDADQELAALREGIGTLSGVELTVLRQPCTLSALGEKLRHHHALHFIGHGAFAGGVVVLYMADDANKVRLVKDRELAGVVARQMKESSSGLKLVFLASCQTATRSPADAFRGLAPQFVRIGVPAVIAMQDLVSIPTARVFAKTFYSRLMEHGFVDLAANEARSSVLTDGLQGAQNPVIFVRLKGGKLLAPEKPTPILRQPRISLAKLPTSGAHLFGREQELEQLDEAWANPDTNIISMVAWGGVGKTALLNHWLLLMGKNDYRGAEAIFGWSFHSQGAAEDKQDSADFFIDALLRWFDDPDPTAGSPWDKGQRLTNFIRGRRTLLVLDGLEPLQHPPGEMGGMLKDPGLEVLLRSLARHNPGLCVLTSRLAIQDLEQYTDQTIRQIDLEHLSPQAGADYLRHLGLQGNQSEFEAASEEFDGHAFALTLLGTYLKVVHQGDIRRRDHIARLTSERRQGAHFRRVMENYTAWFANQPELDLLHLIGLFQRPAEKGAIEALVVEPAIPGLTDQFQMLADEDYYYAVDNLRRTHLLNAEDPRDPEMLDAHPLVREYFGELIHEGQPNAWREAHSRLFDYYKTQAPFRPDSLEGMAPLFAAMIHGCQAGRYHDAFSEVLWSQLSRGRDSYLTRQLGAYGAELAAVAGFFDRPWDRPVESLSDADKSSVLNTAGICLRALGRLSEARRALQSTFEVRQAIEGDIGITYAALDAQNLSEVALLMGDVKEAVGYAQKGVELADISQILGYRILLRASLANAFHQAGRMKEAIIVFEEAQDLEQRQGRQLLSYSTQGYCFNDLLLAQGNAEEVLKRTISRSENKEPPRVFSIDLLSPALDLLARGRAKLMLGMLDEAEKYLDKAIKGLRQAAVQDYLVLGLLARAKLSRLQGTLETAEHTLETALEIAHRGEMGLYEADCSLEYTRLKLAVGETDPARDFFRKAKRMISEMGYSRRDGEVAELAVRLEID